MASFYNAVSFKFKLYSVLIFTAIFTPYVMGFLDNQNAQWIVVLETVVDATFLIDIIMNFHFAFYDHKFEIVDDKAVRFTLNFSLRKLGRII